MRLPVVPGGIRAKAWPPVLATRGPGSQSELHAHHAMHFILAVEGDIGVRTSDKDRWSRAAGVLTAPDILHAVNAEGVEVILIFMDPESDAGAMFRNAFDGPMRLIDSSERAELMHGADPSVFVRDGADEWSRSAARILGLTPTNGSRPIHPRVRKLLSLLRNGQFEGAASLDVLADAVGLSPSRLMHVFTESIGIPLRPYLSWLRLQRAAAAIVSGKASLTEAAHEAGFADAAHMSRSFKRALGVAPSVLRPIRCSSQSVQGT
jgi:AraC-like DNA-binding protein